MMVTFMAVSGFREAPFFAPEASRGLTGLACRLTALALSPFGGRAAEPRAECTRERFGGTESHAERDAEYRNPFL